MKFHLLSLALCAGLAGCYAPYAYYYPRYVIVPASQDPNATQPQATNSAGQAVTVLPYPSTYASPYGYPYGYSAEQYPYPSTYVYPYPYTYPYGYGYGYGYGYAPIWIGGSWWCCSGGHGGHGHGGYGHGGGGQWHGGGGGRWTGGGGGQWHGGGGGGGSHGGRR